MDNIIIADTLEQEYTFEDYSASAYDLWIALRGPSQIDIKNKTNSETYNLSTDSNYTYDSNVELSLGVAQLALLDNTGSYAEDFADDTGFTYDSDLAEFSSGQLQQANKRPTDATFCDKFLNASAANWGDGTLTRTLNGSAVVSGGELDLTQGGAGRQNYADYAGGLNANSGNVGCVDIEIEPNYTGTPAASQVIYCESKAALDGDNTLYFIHVAGTGGIFVVVADQTGGILVFSSLPVWAPTAGVKYTFSFNWDLTAGATRMFVDGTQHGITMAGTGTRSTDIGLIRIGNEQDLTYDEQDFKTHRCVRYSTVQHTTNYTVDWSNVYDYDYMENTVTCPIFVYPGADSIQSFDSFAMSTETNAPKYIVDGKYWNGASWVASDDSYAQANTAADVSTNIGSLTAVSSLSVKIVFQSSNTQGSVDDLTIGYSGKIYSTANPTVLFNSTISLDMVYGFTETSTKTGSDEIKYTLSKDGVEYYYSGGWVISDGTYAQANTAAEIEANKSSFTSVAAVVQVKAFLHSEDGSTTPQLDTVLVSYDESGMIISADGDTFDVNVLASETAGWTAGDYWYQIYVGQSNWATRYTLEEGSVTIESSFSTITDTLDNRSHVKKVLDAIEAVIEGRASKDQHSYSIAGRTLERTPLPDLIMLKKEYSKLYSQELQQEKINRGEAPGNLIKVKL